jgi:hypothetical protein
MTALPPVQRRHGRSGLKLLLAIGIIVGVLSAAAVLGAYLHWRKMKLAMPAIDSTGQFIMLVGSGQIGPAKGLCTDAIDEQRLTDTAEEFQSWGALREVNKYFGGDVRGADDIEVQALIHCDNAKKTLIATWTTLDGVPRLKAYSFKDAPTQTTQPTP